MALIAFLFAMIGCVVGQPPGAGRTYHLQEQTTQGRYWLYMPVDSEEPLAASNSTIPDRSFPLVMTFHGMKPFDNASSQIREWQQEADRYGFVVCAPELSTPDISSPLPLRSKDHPSLQNDEKRILAIMDELIRSGRIDPQAVLSTSWSYGGYLAHYMANRHPDRFSCLAVRQSNFCADLLNPANTPVYRDHKIGIFCTENDFAICRTESYEAAQWYSRHGFDVTFGVFAERGHERAPSVAADFFARTCGAEPKSPPSELATYQVRDFPRAARDATASSSDSDGRPKGEPVPIAALEGNAGTSLNRGVAGALNSPRSEATMRVLPRTGTANTTPEPAKANPAKVVGDGPVRVQISSNIGYSPLLVTYGAIFSDQFKTRGSCLWTDNGEPISSGLNGQKLLVQPGEHHIEVSVVSADGKEYRASQTVTVLDRSRRTQSR